MSVLFAIAWRILHALLSVQRVLFAWLRSWNWRLLLPPADMGLKGRAGGRLGKLHCECRYLTKQCDCTDLRHQCDMNYLTQQCECKFQQRSRSWRADGSSLDKLPVHIALLIGEEQESYTDVANLVVWCMAVGISYISVYDNQGIFKQNKSRFMDEVLKQQKELLGNEYSKYPLEYMNGSTEKLERVPSRLPLLKVLSPEDGKAHIAKAAQSFCELVEQQHKRPDDMNVNVLDQLLRKNLGFPDPDLIMKFGPVESTLGFLPWHIRLSEIISLPSHLNICYEDFFSTLKTYANCEQRLGK
ncbi:dehydrodolichyl diphosphate synthase complex subunit NUS1 [Rhinophrynus dorsalis]